MEGGKEKPNSSLHVLGRHAKLKTSIVIYFGLWPSDDCYSGEGVALGFSRGGFNFRFCRRLVILLWACYLILSGFPILSLQNENIRTEDPRGWKTLIYCFLSHFPDGSRSIRS